jgi:ABC-type nitrate/sulfonate/bicarbonate transport system substrate-binding protein
MKLKAIATVACAFAVTGALSLSGVALAGASPSHGVKKGATLKFKHGKPTLKGVTIKVINAAGSAHIGDTNVHDWVKIMASWGATITQTNASHNAGELAVEGGKATVSVGPLPTELDAGLTTFGPNQVHLTDYLYGKTTVKGLKDLKGKTVAFCCTASPDGIMLHAILKKTGLNRSTLHLLSTGASTASMSALIEGKVTAAFFAAATLPPTAVGKFRKLTDATALLPEYADSFMSARGSWLKTHQKDAVAIDLAWLASAKIFNTNENAWVKDAQTYTSTADPVTAYKSAWKALRTLNGWPVAESAYSSQIVNFNYNAANQLGTITGLGTRPRSQEVTQKAWKEAWKLWKKYGKKL